MSETIALRHADSSVGSWIDQVRYPIEDLETPAGRTLVRNCRDVLRETAICELTDFLTASALARLTEEARALAPKAYRRDNHRYAY